MVERWCLSRPIRKLLPVLLWLWTTNAGRKKLNAHEDVHLVPIGHVAVHKCSLSGLISYGEGLDYEDVSITTEEFGNS